jgi:hypothetical protein
MQSASPGVQNHNSPGASFCKDEGMLSFECKGVGFVFSFHVKRSNSKTTTTGTERKSQGRSSRITNQGQMVSCARDFKELDPRWRHGIREVRDIRICNLREHRNDGHLLWVAGRLVFCEKPSSISYCPLEQ